MTYDIPLLAYEGQVTPIFEVANFKEEGFVTPRRRRKKYFWKFVHVWNWAQVVWVKGKIISVLFLAFSDFDIEIHLSFR